MIGKICILLTITLILLSAVGFTTLSNTQSASGERLYTMNCSRCHGRDGTKGFWGAKNLNVSVLSDSSIARQIRQGKGFMPSFKTSFRKEDLQLLIRYVKTLRTH